MESDIVMAPDLTLTTVPLYDPTHLAQAKYIAQCIEEIKQELRQDNMAVKVNAVQKLTYVSYPNSACARF